MSAVAIAELTDAERLLLLELSEPTRMLLALAHTPGAGRPSYGEFQARVIALSRSRATLWAYDPPGMMAVRRIEGESTIIGPDAEEIPQLCIVGDLWRARVRRGVGVRARGQHALLAIG